MIEFWFHGLVSEAESPMSLPDLLVHTTADFRLEVDGVTLYAENDFPVIELAASLAHWASLSASIRPDFEFDSMSTPEPGWVWLRRDLGGWRAGSIHQLRADLTEWTELEVQRSISDLVMRVVKSCRAGLGIEVTELLPGLDGR